jgi:hypothetical protein
MAIEINNIATGVKAVVEGAGAIRTTLRPNDTGLLGSYVFASGVGGGTFPVGPVFSARWPSAAAVCVVRRVRIRLFAYAPTTSNGFALIQAQLASAYTTPDTGQSVIDLSTGACKKRSTMANSQFGANNMVQMLGATNNTAGLRTLATNPFTSAFVASLTGTMPTLDLDYNVTDQSQPPLVLLQNQGIVVSITSQALSTSSVQMHVHFEWDEFATY